jgi:hypothetical protein
VRCLTVLLADPASLFSSKFRAVDGFAGFAELVTAHAHLPDLYFLVLALFLGLFCGVFACFVRLFVCLTGYKFYGL